MKNDISLILNEFHRRRQFFTLQAELETRQTDILALDYEMDHASGPFQSKKKKSLMQKREVLQAQLTSLKEEISRSALPSLRSLADQWDRLMHKDPLSSGQNIAEILHFALATERYYEALEGLDQALNECFVELIRVPNQVAITNKAVNLTPILSLLPEFLQHDQQYRRAVHQLNQKALLPAPLRLYRVDFTGFPEIDKRSELRFIGKRCQKLKNNLSDILRQLEDQAICLISEIIQESCGDKKA